jgi:hypothetical protein
VIPCQLVRKILCWRVSELKQKAFLEAGSYSEFRIWWQRNVLLNGLSLMFVPCFTRRSINNQHYALNLFNIQDPTCFGSGLPSSGSFLNPSEVLEMQIRWVVYHIIQGDSLARGPEFRETHSSVLGCEMRPFSALIMSRSCFASLVVCVCKFSSHYLNNIIFYRQ